jgi:hypothetical protein
MTKEHTNKRYGKELSDLSNELVEMGELVAGQIRSALRSFAIKGRSDPVSQTATPSARLLG